MNTITDAIKLAVGTLTLVPVRPPRAVTPAVAAIAMVLAPLAAIPVAATGCAALYLGDILALPPLLTSTIAVAALALSTGALHLDGLADTADGFATPGGPDRRLDVMRRGDIGPAGATALVFVLLAQIGSLTGLLTTLGTTTAAVALLLAVIVSRTTLAVACARGIRNARPDGLGSAVSGTVPVVAVIVVGLATAATATGIHQSRGLAGVLAATGAVLLLLTLAHRKIGGVSGDVLGACVEVAFTAYLLAAVANPSLG